MFAKYSSMLALMFMFIYMDALNTRGTAGLAGAEEHFFFLSVWKTSHRSCEWKELLFFHCLSIHKKGFFGVGKSNLKNLDKVNP